MPAGLIALIVPTYNVARYLPEFLASLERQTFGLADLEIIFVDDGSPDDSAAIIQRWAARVAPHTQLVRQANGGAAAARNAALGLATSTWLTFPDPDDRFSETYFAEVAGFLTSSAAQPASLVATRLMILDDDTGLITDTHPLRFKFVNGRHVVDLSEDPRYIHLQAPSAFYRREVFEQRELRFETDIKPNFEDAYLTTRYLATFDRPKIALIPEAEYQYRQRGDGSSLVQSSWTQAEKYTVLPRLGYLRLLETIRAELGVVPEWVQNVVLYDLFFFFRTDVRLNSPLAAIPTVITEEFHATLEQIMTYVDAEVIDTYRVAWVSREMRQAMLVGAKKDRQRPTTAVLTKLDAPRRLVQVSYYYAGSLPTEEFLVDGVAVAPLYAKIRSVVFLNRVMMYERLAWLPATQSIRVRIDGNYVVVRPKNDQPGLFAARSIDYWRQLANRPVPGDKYLSRTSGMRARVATLRERAATYAAIAARRPELVRTRLEDIALRRLARKDEVRERYASAWILMDRDTQAQDNAEALYRHLRRAHPKINAWFVLSRRSSDWARLEADGFRLLDHGSREYYLALLNCIHVVSSQVDHYVVAPFHERKLGSVNKGNWSYTFLQHGVTKDDLSRWTNSKPIDLFITATPDEHELIVGDYTPYNLTELETVMTGFPRHDRLLSLGREVDSSATAGPRRLLVMPTWRRDLLGETVGRGNDRALRDDFWESEYAKAWRELLESDRLHALCDRAGWELAFVPHPNMQDYVATSPLPDHIKVFRFRDIDVQEVMASGAVIVTDYSSLAFEMAYLNRAVVYYQFDRDAFFSGAHAYRRGTWSYEDNGFGPITQTAEETLWALEFLADRGGEPEAHYAARMDNTFPFRDGECSERTVHAIEQLRKPVHVQR